MAQVLLPIRSMRLVVSLLFVAAWTLGTLCGNLARAEEPIDRRLEKMPRDLETEFALSALPGHLRGGAGVLLLDPAKGYVPAQPSKNGFTCVVERTDWHRVDFRNDIYTALCYD